MSWQWSTQQTIDASLRTRPMAIQDPRQANILNATHLPLANKVERPSW